MSKPAVDELIKLLYPTAPNGTVYKLVVDNTGALTATPVT